MQSIESHDRQIGELVERMDKMAQGTEVRFAQTSARIDKLAEVTQLNFDRLTKAMTGLTEHIVDHQHRLEYLAR